MVLTGIAIYITYGVMGSPVYDRLIAYSRLDGTATLLIFLSDMSGYVGLLVIVFYNIFSPTSVSYMATFLIAIVATACTVFIMLLPVMVFFWYVFFLFSFSLKSNETKNSCFILLCGCFFSCSKKNLELHLIVADIVQDKNKQKDTVITNVVSSASMADYDALDA